MGNEDQQEAAARAFIERWQGSTASELSTAQSFVIQLCALLGVEAPHPTPEQSYMFERPITFQHGDGSSSAGRIDCYKRGAFVLEAKKLKAGSHTKGFDDALLRARAQAEGYARALPASEGRPPFVLVVDVGHVIELYAEFSRSGATYTPFPDPRSHRIRLADLADAAQRERLRRIWTDPLSLDPARVSAQVTREVAVELAAVAKSLEADGHRAEVVAAFLTRCLFSMFVEDVGLLPAAAEGLGGFQALLARYRDDPRTLQRMLAALWADMDRGGFCTALAQDVLRFNGKLFKGAGSDGYALPLSPAQIDGLQRAASKNWREVEPAIFGTLLERALDPTERHALGAHYTPRAYVERLVLPTVIEPLRADWADAQAAALLLAHEAEALEGPKNAKKREQKMEEARAELRRFHHQLCTTRVLDPACGSGNFLYVTLEHLKRLEGEVLNQLETLGERQDKLGLEGETVTLQQLRGIEINPRAAALAELVLWIGWLQWHIRTRGPQSVAEPVVHDYGNIECRDAVLAYDRVDIALDANGKPLTRWDGKTFKKHPVTGEDVPDEAAKVPQWTYVNARQAEWPEVEFIVGNPPFIGNKRMRDALGDGYVDALRSAWKSVPESADFVMYWWDRAAATVRAGRARQFGLITTNSLTMIFNRRVIEGHQNANPSLGLVFAIPDHPWVDSAQGAAVRISMTVGAREAAQGRLLATSSERETGDGEIAVSLTSQVGTIHADLKVGANLTSALPLKANGRLSNRGVIPHGAGFLVTADEASTLGLGTDAAVGSCIRPYRNGRDLADRPRGMLVIDLHGLSADQARSQFPALYQWLLERVKPERDLNPRKSRRENWWLFAENQPRMRDSLVGLDRYIATGQVAKHRLFQLLDAHILPDDKLIAIASSDGLHLGVLSSSIHARWAVAAGGRLGVGNDPVYSKTTCFEKFPFPADDTGLTPELTERIRTLAEQIDAHRKRQQAAHESVTLTGIYNVLDKLRKNEPLNAKDKLLHEQGLVSVLRTLHDELDAAVLAAYGWADLGPVPWAEAAAHEAWTEQVLERLVALNARRAAEEAQGLVRWLRPDYQDPARRQAQAPTPAAEAPAEQVEIETPESAEADTAPPASEAKTARRAWPAGLPEQMRAVAEVLAASPLALDEERLAAHFSSRGPWKKRLPQILEALEAVGRARHDAGAWRAA
jgi:hypothetical protein